jgi:flavine halogenase
MIGRSLLFDQVLLSSYSIGNVKDTDCCFHTVIQGALEMGSRLSAEELQNALEFCGKCFNPTSPNSLSAASKEVLPKEVFDASAPLVDPQAIQSIITKTFNHTSPKSDEELSGAEEELKLALDQINGRRVMHPEHNVNNMETEEVNGFVVRLQQGNLGLVRA